MNNHKNIASSKVFEAIELVNYTEDGIVSRIICENGVNSVTIMAFDEKQALSEHTVPFNALVYVVDGTGEFTIGYDKYILKAGQIILMPANMPHSVNALSQFKMILTMLRS
ncbi:MAG: cupin domain-containing protein [Alphaproteobacteria bacterium]